MRRVFEAGLSWKWIQSMGTVRFEDNVTDSIVHFYRIDVDYLYDGDDISTGCF